MSGLAIKLVYYFIEIAIIILFYMAVLKLLKYTYDTAKNQGDRKFFNLSEYLPGEEVHTLRQVFFLIIIAISFTIIIYTIISMSVNTFSDYFVSVDILLSLIVCLIMKKETTFDKIVILTLIPFASTVFSLLDYFKVTSSFQMLIDPTLYFITLIFIALHLIGFAYVIKVYIAKFTQYTESHGLGITILLLIGIVFISFLITPLTEGVDLLDSLNMVSNAFTSNGYTVLGTTALGKLNSIFLVWGGYLLSGVGTATLATALISSHFNKKFEKMEEQYNKLQESIDALSEEKNNKINNPDTNQNKISDS